MRTRSLKAVDIRLRAATAGLSVREERLDEVAALMTNNLASLRQDFKPAAVDGVPDDFLIVLARDD